MATKRSAKKSKKKAVQVSSKKDGGRKKPVTGRSKQAAESHSECGEFETYVHGNTLSIRIVGDAEFDASVVIVGDACRTLLPCKIVNGQWEC